MYFIFIYFLFVTEASFEWWRSKGEMLGIDGQVAAHNSQKRCCLFVRTWRSWPLLPISRRKGVSSLVSRQAGDSRQKNPDQRSKRYYAVRGITRRLSKLKYWNKCRLRLFLDFLDTSKKKIFFPNFRHHNQKPFFVYKKTSPKTKS